MIELQHQLQAPPSLDQYIQDHPNPTPKDFDSKDFIPIKHEVKAQLHKEQDGLCVYCESPLEPDTGQVEHIKPKGGPSARPDLCFTYTNYAHSCINNNTCGQSKGDRTLPIEPSVGCNDRWTLDTTNGRIVPRIGMDKGERHAVEMTRDMLGLNRDTALVSDRLKWIENATTAFREMPHSYLEFLQSAPYRHILKTLQNAPLPP